MERKILFPKVDGFVHGGDYNPDQWLDRPDILAKDIELFKEAHINCVTLGVFSWASYELHEGQFTFKWLTDIMDNLYENGIYTILATPTGARPAWLDKKYEECRRVDSFGRREYHKERHNYCMSSEVFREKAAIIDTKLAEAVKGHPGLILWHISNELGGYCYCDKCTNKFHKWLEKKYTTIDNLNHEWWTTFWAKKFESFDQIDPPYENGEVAIKGLLIDWKRFQTENATDFMVHEINTVKKITPGIPFTTNMMMYFGDYDYRVLAKELDVISWDGYPRFHNDYESLFDTMASEGFTHATMRSLIKGKPFMLMESTPSLPNWHLINKLKKPGVHNLVSLQAVATGSDTVQYFQLRKSRGSAEQFHGAVIDHNGTNETRVYKEVKQLGANLLELKDVIGSLVDAKVAILYDWDNRWALDTTEAFVKLDKKYEETLYDFYNELTKLGVDVDIISRDYDFSDYKVIYTPMTLIVTSELAEKLKKFVSEGGTVVSTYMMGYTNENQLAHLGGFPGEGLTEVFGILNEEIDTLWPTQSNHLVFEDGSTVEIKDYCEIVHLKTAKALATYTEDFYKGCPVITVNNYGKGKAYYFAARFKNRDVEDLHKQILEEAEVSYKNLPLDVECHTRVGESTFEFYLNDSNEEKVVEEVYGTNLLNKQTVNGKLLLSGYEVAVIKK